MRVRQEVQALPRAIGLTLAACPLFDKIYSNQGHTPALILREILPERFRLKGQRHVAL